MTATLPVTPPVTPPVARGSDGPTPRQIKAIHSLSKICGQTREDYEHMLMGFANATSCLDLDSAQTSDLIDHLLRLSGAKPPLEGDVMPALPYAHLQGRPAIYATPAQLRLIDVLWSQVSRAEGKLEQSRALDTFLRRRFRIGGMDWLKRRDVQKVIAAVKAMKKQKVESL